MEVAVHGISGAISGVTAILVWYPLDILRFRAQAEVLKEKEEKTDSNVVDNTDTNLNINTSSNELELEAKENKTHDEPHNNNNNNNNEIHVNLISYLQKYFKEKLHTFNFAFELIKREGVSTLYNGMTSALVGTVASYGIYFFSYKLFKDLLEGYNLKKGIIIDSMITSFLASCATVLGSNPIWVLNSRMAKSKKDVGNKTNLEMIKQIYNEEGIGAFFKGVVPAIILTINPVIQFILYEFLRAKLVDEKGNISGINIIIISIISKLITTLITYPMLTVKTLFQANENKPNKEIFAILNKMMQEEGIGGYYKGKNNF
jgi:adenine nucleotide transporter 17